MSETVKVIVTLSKGQYEALKDVQFGGIGSRMIFNAVKNGMPLDDVLDKISAEIEEVNEDLDGYDPDSLSTLFCKTLAILERYKKEVGDKC